MTPSSVCRDISTLWKPQDNTGGTPACVAADSIGSANSGHSASDWITSLRRGIGLESKIRCPTTGAEEHAIRKRRPFQSKPPPTFSLGRARATPRRSSGSSHGTSNRCSVSPAADCPGGRRDLADTDDLVQDALLQTFKRMDAFEPRHPGALQAYLRQAVLNRLRDELRRKARAPCRVGVDDADLVGSPLEEAVGRETMAAYEQALARLKAEEREAVIGRLEMGFSYDELALALDKPTADAARKAAQRALVRLAEEMQREQ